MPTFLIERTRRGDPFRGADDGHHEDGRPRSELALLLERWSLVKSGDGQAVLLVGEAGIGKSRIVRHSRALAEDDCATSIPMLALSGRQRAGAGHPAIAPGRRSECQGCQGRPVRQTGELLERSAASRTEDRADLRLFGLGGIEHYSLTVCRRVPGSHAGGAHASIARSGGGPAGRDGLGRRTLGGPDHIGADGVVPGRRRLCPGSRLIPAGPTINRRSPPIRI